MTAADRPLVLGRPGLVFDLVARALAGTSIEGDHAVVVTVDPDPDQWDAARQSGARIVLVRTGGVTPDAAARAVIDGADAVLDGSAAADELRAAVVAVAHGHTVLAGEVARALADRARTMHGPDNGAAKLSGREAEILGCINRGLSVKQTARELGVADKTVENLQSRLYRKLEARNRAQAVTRAHELGLLG